MKKVADGYVCNYLLPKNLAALATPGMLKQIDRIRITATKVRDLANAEMAGLAEQLANLEIKFTANVGENGKLFGSITQQMIVDAIKEKLKVEIDRHQVESQPLREAGEHKVRVRLTFDLIPQVKVLVEAEKKEEEPVKETRSKAPRRRARSFLRLRHRRSRRTEEELEKKESKPEELEGEASTVKVDEPAKDTTIPE